MTNLFNLNDFLKANRNVVIEKYELATENAFFNGASLKDFMIQTVSLMNLNAPKTEKRALVLLPNVLNSVYSDNTKSNVKFDRDAFIAKKYEGTVFAQNLAL